MLNGMHNTDFHCLWDSRILLNNNYSPWGTRWGWILGTVSWGKWGENGYFIVFWHFRPSFKLILHTSKWILCKQKFWELFISILGSLQHKFYGHLDCLNRKFIGGVTFTRPPRACPMNRDPRLNRVKSLSWIWRASSMAIDHSLTCLLSTVLGKLRGFKAGNIKKNRTSCN